MVEPRTDIEPQQPKSRKLLILFSAAMALVAAGGGFAGWRYFKHAKGGADAARAVEAKAEPSGKPEMKSTLNLEPFLVNLADADNPRFLKVTFRLGLAEAKMGEELAGDPVALAITRDTIISLLSSKMADQVLTAQGKLQLREEVRTRVNAALPKGKIGEVYIVDFVVQM